MFLAVEKVRYLDHYRLYVEFNNQQSGIVDLEDTLWGEVFAPLKEDIHLFQTAKVDPLLKTISWDNGADVAPEFLFAHLKKAP